MISDANLGGACPKSWDSWRLFSKKQEKNVVFAEKVEEKTSFPPKKIGRKSSFENTSQSPLIVLFLPITAKIVLFLHGKGMKLADKSIVHLSIVPHPGVITSVGLGLLQALNLSGNIIILKLYFSCQNYGWFYKM